ncbi:HEPN domain-containing protein [Lonsdalea quercina]|uniref:HEPN domain-containing protein n=1 Tax=Lonsdalea quercina TaxID=71657 RepID=UPI0039769F9C
MYNAFINFKHNLEESKALSALYNYLVETVHTPMPYDDVLRAQFVYSVSAFDKFMHDIILIGLVDTYIGARSPTDKYYGEVLPMRTIDILSSSTLPPPEFHFREAMRAKLKIISYQDPNKIADGLSYIWRESHKWAKVAVNMGLTEDVVKTKLRLIADRRNAIVHESDVNPATQKKFVIDAISTNEITQFLHDCGTEIYNLVK